MSTMINSRLAQLGLALPDLAGAPAAAYQPALDTGTQLFISGQLPLQDGMLAAIGLVGADVSVAQAQEAAKICAVHVLAQARAALGTLDRVQQVAKITVFVASAPGFAEQHLVANGASELLTAVLGTAGEHSRSAVGVAGLPLNAAVEVEAVLNLSP